MNESDWAKCVSEIRKDIADRADVQLRTKQVYRRLSIPFCYPEHKREIDHVECKKIKCYIDELPESAESLNSYDGHDLDGVLVDRKNKNVYLFNGVKYRKLVPIRINGRICYYVRDIDNEQVSLFYKVLFC